MDLFDHALQLRDEVFVFLARGLALLRHLASGRQQVFLLLVKLRNLRVNIFERKVARFVNLNING